MVIDLTGIATNIDNEIIISSSVNFDSNWYVNTSIRDLCCVKFDGRIVRKSDSNYHLSGYLDGVMILPDDITLEDVKYPFHIEIDENIPLNGNESFKIINNKLDIIDFLWQNILVEVPLKVKSSKNDNLTMEGNGWRLVTEDEVNRENNSPLSELSKIFDSRKE